MIKYILEKYTKMVKHGWLSVERVWFGNCVFICNKIKAFTIFKSLQLFMQKIVPIYATAGSRNFGPKKRTNIGGNRYYNRHL